MFKKDFNLKFFCSQLHILLKTGLSLTKSLLVLSKQMSSEEDKKLIQEILKDLEKGNSLAESLAKKEEFPPLFTSVIKAGEKTGSLVQVINNLEKYYQNQSDLKNKLHKVCFYPITILTTLIISAVFLMKIIMPIFLELFAEFQGQLPLLTRIFLRLSLIIEEYLFLILLVFLTLILSLIYLFLSQKENGILEKIIFKLPILGRLYQYLILTKIASYLAIFLKSGMKLLPALKLLENIIASHQYKLFINNTILAVSKGGSLTESFADKDLIPDTFYYLLLSGEETVQMETMLERSGDYYYQKLKLGSERLLQYLEPFLITLTAVFVALLAAAVITPMFQLYLII
ncbi:MAG: type II secretion system F family protein [Halanaerobium sp. MSAO_Bac5]|nr:MAG: type II secretion system F family protein [Halanaerobium sp. MSAO_Bac5]